MNLPQIMMLRSRRLLFLRIMIMIWIMRHTWSLSQLQSLPEMVLTRDHDGFMTLFRMQQDIYLLEGLSERARGFLDI